MKPAFVLLLVLLALKYPSLAQAQSAVDEGLKIVVGKNDDELTGPNCFNFALFNIGFSKGLTYSSVDEIKEVLSLPACRQLRTSEPTLIGDVGILSKDDEWLHAFSYLDPETVFTKNGMVESTSYRKMSFEKMLGIYSNLYQAECRECMGVQAGDRLYKECRYCLAPVKPQRFRCRQFHELAAQTFSPIISSLLVQAGELEVRSEQLYFKKHELSLESALDLNLKILRLAKRFRLAAANTRADDASWLTIIRHKIEALQLSTEDLRRLAGDPDPHGLQTEVHAALRGDY